MSLEKAKEVLLERRKILDNGCWVLITLRKRKVDNRHRQLIIDGEIWSTHRLSWIIHNGPIPHGKHVCHKCDYPPCFNPEHLFIGTTQENTADRHEKKRDAFGQRNGNSKLSDEQVIEIRKRYDGQYGRIKQLAQEYRVSSDQIRNIIRGKQRMVEVDTIDWKTNRLRRVENEYLGGRKTKSDRPPNFIP